LSQSLLFSTRLQLLVYLTFAGAISACLLCRFQLPAQGKLPLCNE
jgi:hypothetical protein